MARVLAAVKRAGVADRDIQTATVQLQPQYRYGDNVPPVITGYQATNTLSVRFRDVAKSGSVLDALVAQGANQIDGPNLSIDKPTPPWTKPAPMRSSVPAPVPSFMRRRRACASRGSCRSPKTARMRAAPSRR